MKYCFVIVFLVLIVSCTPAPTVTQLTIPPTETSVVQTTASVLPNTVVSVPTGTPSPISPLTPVPLPSPIVTSTPRLPTLSQLAKPFGIRLGTTVNGADPWTNPLYWKRVGEFSIVAPIGYTVEDVFNGLTPQGAGQFGEQFKTTLSDNKSTFRLYGLFFHADYRNNPSDPLWKGAPPKGQPPSPEYKDVVGKAMDDKIRWVLTTHPEISELGFANEAFWEFQGNTGWEDSPFYRAFGEDWLIEAYVRTYKIAEQLGRTPGQDLILFYGDYNFEVPNQKVDFVYQNLARLETAAADRLRGEGFNIAKIPLVVEMQLHVDFDNPPKAGELYRGDLTEDGLLNNLTRFGNLGKVWIGEFSIRGGTRKQRTEVASLVLNACLKSRGTCESIVFWELMRRNGFYADGDLLFDHSLQPTDTYNAIAAILSHGVP